MSKIIKFSLASCVLVLAAACGGGNNQSSPVEQVSDQPEEMIKLKPKEILAEWRKDVTLGEGGSFQISVGDESYQTNWGYADIRYFAGTDSSRITLFSNAKDGDSMPVLRIAVLGPGDTAEGFVGQTLSTELQTMRLEKKQSPLSKGEGQLTISAVADGFIEGTITGTMDDKPFECTFRAKLNIFEQE